MTRNGGGGTKSGLSQAYGLEPQSSRSQLVHLRTPTSRRLTTTCLMKPFNTKNPPIQTMQIWRNPPIPGTKGREKTTRNLTTHSTPRIQQSILPRLSESLIPDTLKNIRNRLETPTKEDNRSKRRVRQPRTTYQTTYHHQLCHQDTYYELVAGFFVER